MEERNGHFELLCRTSSSTPADSMSNFGLAKFAALFCSLLLFVAHPVLGWADNAGTVCSVSGSDISEMVSSRHGSQTSGGGFAVSAEAGSGDYSITLSGSSYKGLLLIGGFGSSGPERDQTTHPTLSSSR